ncbi:hypothetical protein [Citricoccus muralis]|uniref:Membrane protein DUF2157 n=1 Tax=Citricoccus muralis TaxID=169134 RepID=A0ABY8H440_9MICC|nr:hypothetical protein [Citricoccus muralis]WFP15855.1 hypothetical protein P8192_10670 [Citricoccus muralis]
MVPGGAPTGVGAATVPLQRHHATVDPEAGARRQRRNINITLYIAALLIVAASALFLTSTLPHTARMVGILCLIGLFYAGGLILHRVSVVLRPAALAFTGTGLAMIPLAGVALDQLGLNNPALSWLITSVLGLILMVIAAERFDSRVAVYLTMPFVISVSLSVGAVLQRGMVWGLLLTIFVSVAMTWLGRNARSSTYHPTRWDRYRGAMHQTHMLLVPAIIAATLVLGFSLPAREVLALLLAAAAYYVNAAAVLSSPRARLWQTYAARVLVTLAFIPAGSVLNWSWSATVALLGGILLVQSVLVLSARRWNVLQESRFTPTGVGALRDAGVCFGVAVFIGLAARGGALFDTGTWMIDGLVITLVLVAIGYTVIHGRAEQAASFHLAMLGVMVLATVPVWVDSSGHGWLQQSAAAGIALGALGHRYRRRSDNATSEVRWDRWWALQLAAVALILLLWMLSRTMEMPSSHAQIIAGLLVMVWACVSLLIPAHDLPGRGAPEAAWGSFAGVSMWLMQAGLYTSVDVLDLGTAGGWLLVGIVMVLFTCATVRLRARNHGSQWALMVVPTVMAWAILPYLYGHDLVFTGVGVWTLIAAWLWLIALLPSVGLMQPLRRVGVWGALIVALITVPHLVDELGAAGSWIRIALAATAVGILLAYRYVNIELIPVIHRNVAGGLLLMMTVMLWFIEVGSGQDRLAAVLIAGFMSAYFVLIERRWGPVWCAVISGTFLTVSLSPVLDLSNGPLRDAVFPAFVLAPLLWALTITAAVVDLRLRRTSTSTVPASAERKVGEWLMAPVISAVAWLLGAMVSVDHVESVADWGWMLLGLVAFPFVVLIFARSRNVSILVPVAAAIGAVATLAGVSWWGEYGMLWGSDWDAGLRFALVHMVSALLMVLVGRAVSIPQTWAVPLMGTAIRPVMMFLRSGALGLLLGGAVALWASPDHPALTILAVLLALVAGWLIALHIARVGWSWGPEQADLPSPLQNRNIHDIAMAWSLLNLSIAADQLTDPHFEGAVWWIISGASFAMIGWGLRHHLQRADGERIRIMIWWYAGMTVFTVNATVVIAEPTAARQLAVIICFAAFIAIGLIVRDRITLVWGAVGVGLSILYYLRWLPYLWLGALGVALIVLAIWQLKRLSRQRSSQQDDRNTTIMS